MANDNIHSRQQVWFAIHITVWGKQCWNVLEWIHAKSFIESWTIAQKSSKWCLKEEPKRQVIVTRQRHIPSQQHTISTTAGRLVLLGRVALGAQRPIVVKLSRERFVGLSVGRSVCTWIRPCVGLSSALWKNGGSDPDAVWHHRSDRCRDEAGSGVWGSVHGKGYFWGRIWGAPL